jgi:hypothetical protein
VPDLICQALIQPLVASYVQVTGAAALSMEARGGFFRAFVCALPFVRDSSFQASGTEATTLLRKRLAWKGA